jgi:hypothetical protein
MQYCSQGGIIECQIASQRADGGSGEGRHSRNRLLHVGDQGLHIAAVTGIAHGKMQAKDKAHGGLGDRPGFAAKLGGAMTLPFANGRNRGIVRVDDRAMGQGLVLQL